MSNSDYYSRPDRYKAAINIKPTPKPELAPTWLALRFAIILAVVALVVIGVTGSVIARAVLL